MVECVYYNNGQSFVDYPATNLTDTTRWKILQFPKVTQSFEATVLAKKEYDNYKKSPLKINVCATKLKLTGSDVGFEKSSNYIETSTQRMQTKLLEKININCTLISMHTIKPFDEEGFFKFCI